MKIAVILCVYRSDDPASFLTAIESILVQTQPCDLLIYQDGSIPADLQSVLSRYENSNNVVIFKSEKNNGLAFGLNFLIDYAMDHGYKFIARMDSDDISMPDRIEKQLEFFIHNPKVGVLGTSCHEFGASYAINEKHLPQEHDKLVNFSIARCPFIHPSVMFRYAVFANGTRYPTNTHLTEDMALWFDLLRQGVIFANLNDVLINYRLNENTVQRRSGIKKALSECKIRMYYMFILKKITARNIIFVLSRIFFHVLPIYFLKFAYKKMR